MNLTSLLRPQPTISEDQLNRGLRMLTGEGIASMAMFSVTTSGILAAFALALGANNFQIGILASIPFLMQPIQIPVILVVERFRHRKAIALLAWIPAQAVWIPIALIPVFLEVPSAPAVSLLLFLMGVRSVLTAIMACAWNSWMRDLVPQEIMGRFYSRRLALATVAAIIFGLAGAFFVEFWQDNASPENQPFGYTYVLLFGAIFLGMASPAFISQVPEPAMQPLTGPVPSLRRLLSKPFQDRNFRQLLTFLFSWGFAVNLAVPFFTIYMLQRLEFPLMSVIALNTLAQITNVLFLRVWGPFADRFGSKTVLSTCISLYLLVILGWAFTTMPDRYALTVPLVITLQVFAGIAAAGVNLTVGTIGLKLAPQGESTAFMATASLATNLGAGLGPLVGGRFVDFFSVRELTITFGWLSPSNDIQFDAISLTGFDFLFVIAFLLGLFTLNFLTRIQEEGAVEREVLLDELVAPTREMTRSVSGIPGMSVLGEYPYGYLRKIPGMDVAMGVTAYQLASTTRTAAVAASLGAGATQDVAQRVGRAVTEVVEHSTDLGEFGVEVARNATRGAALAADEAVADVGRLARGAIIGTLGALRHTVVNPTDALRGAVAGTIQGAREAGTGLTGAVEQALDAARVSAHQLGLSETAAIAQAAESAIEAAAALDPESEAEVRRVVEEQGIQVQVEDDLQDRSTETT